MASTITVSWTEISSLRKCAHQHALAYRERWRAPTISDALSRGKLFHQVQESHWRVLKEAQDNHTEITAKQLYRQVVALWLRPDIGQPNDEQELVAWMYEGFLHHYGLRPEWHILAVEHPAEVWLRTERGGRSRFKLKFKIDLIVRWAGKIWVVDWKTGKDLPKQRAFEIDDQFGLYTWGMRQLGRPVFGSIHSAVRTLRYADPDKPQPLEERFVEHQMYRTDRELDIIALEAYRTVKQGYSIPAHEAPRSPDPGPFGCRGCDFQDPCLFGRKGNDERQYLRDAKFYIDKTRH